MAPGRASVKRLGLLSILSLGMFAAAQDNTCVETNGDGDCSIDGCCENLVPCTDDGSCVIPTPMCTPGSCEEGFVCAAGSACADEESVAFLINPDDDPLVGVATVGGEEVNVYTVDGVSLSWTTIYSSYTNDMGTVHWEDGMAQSAEVMTEEGLLTVLLHHNSDGVLVSFDFFVGGESRALQDASSVRKLTGTCKAACETVTTQVSELLLMSCENEYERCLLSDSPVPFLLPILCGVLRSICKTIVVLSVVAAETVCIDKCECPTVDPTPAPTNASSMAYGDPHLVGFRGQKFDFTGQGGGYYALLVDDSETLLIMKLHAPVPSVPEITYIVGFALRAKDLNDEPHTVEVFVNHPEDFYAPTQCPGEVEEPCLADGAVTVLLDGEPMTSPGMQELAPGIIVGAANLPGECRPFGFENYWAKKVREAELAASVTGRRLEAVGIPMNDWILGDFSATNILECETFVAKAMEQDDLFEYQSEHVSFQIVTPRVVIRANHGKLHQIAMRDPTDTFDLPDHRTFQQNIAIEKAVLGTRPRGVLGETISPIMDDAGEPIMSVMAAIPGGEEDYRVSGPFMADFAMFAFEN